MYCNAPLSVGLPFGEEKSLLCEKSLAARKMAEGVMSALVSCHCGFISVLSWRPHPLPHQPSDTLTDTDPPVPLPDVGVSCFAYLLFSEKVALSTSLWSTPQPLSSTRHSDTPALSLRRERMV